jgi:thiol-disulfide isomerase/thioredoxin
MTPTPLPSLLALVLFVAGQALSVAAADGPAVPTLAIGAAAPDFDLPGIDGKRHTLASFSAAKVLVLVFTANHCPTAQAYEERILRLAADFAGRGVALVLVSPNDPLAVRLDEQGYSDLGDSLADMKRRAADRGWTLPYLYDGETQQMARRYGPAATPHVFVFDAARRLRYVGRVDDNENPAKATTADARAAIEAVLAEEGRLKWAQEPVSVETVDEAGVKALAKGDAAKLRLVNVWATWCGPCVIEFPDLVSLHRIYRGRDFEVVTLNADEPGKHAKVLAFLKEQQASMRNLAFARDDAYALIEAVDPQWQGALPHTVLVAPGGKVIYRSDGAFDLASLRKAIVGWLGRYYHSLPGGATTAGR